MSQDSRCLAFFLNGTTQEDDDIYVMINADEKDVRFTIQEGHVRDWRRFVDTSHKSPDDICDVGQEIPVKSRKYLVKARSIAVLVRNRRHPEPLEGRENDARQALFGQ